MSSPQPNLATEARLTQLAERLRNAGSFTIADAAEDLGVSEMTIRRDIAELEERGLARRVRGGALAIGPQTFAERKASHTRAKSIIAGKLAPMIPAVGTVAFDASSTVMRVVAAISGTRDLTVLTNGPDTFQALQGRPGVSPLLTGGRLDARTGSLVGPLAAWSAAQVAPDIFFCSAYAVDTAKGASEIALEEAAVKRSIALGAHRIVVAVDSSKLDQHAVALGIGWDAIDLLVTELPPGDRRLARYRALTEVV